LKSLAEHGIVELSLAARDPDPATDNLGETAGNEVTGVGEFRRQTIAPDHGEGNDNERLYLAA